MIYQATPDMTERFLSWNTAFLEPSSTISEEANLSFIEQVLAGLTVNRATENMSGTVIGIDFDYTELQHWIDPAELRNSVQAIGYIYVDE